MADEDVRHPGRRDMLFGVAAAGIASGAVAAPVGGAAGGIEEGQRVADLVHRERAARDAGRWGEMAACWGPDADVDVSWFRGDGTGFVAATRRNAASGRISVHQLSPTVVDVSGTRAIAETPCQLMSFVPVDGTDVCVTGVVRLLWRARRRADAWMIAGLRMIYVRDLMVPCSPGASLIVNEAELAGYRPSYRFLSYVLARSPNRPRNDLPGVDRPETVDAVRAVQARWLRSA